ncbi:hypothetical protein BGX27_006831 [Mortierella sp. AM989]|nr:hypothetical protein BGX27_006831 [Mortierella sp. AM989]
MGDYVQLEAAQPDEDKEEEGENSAKDKDAEDGGKDDELNVKLRYELGKVEPGSFLPCLLRSFNLKKGYFSDVEFVTALSKNQMPPNTRRHAFIGTF